MLTTKHLLIFNVYAGRNQILCECFEKKLQSTCSTTYMPQEDNYAQKFWKISNSRLRTPYVATSPHLWRHLQHQSAMKTQFWSRT